MTISIYFVCLSLRANSLLGPKALSAKYGNYPNPPAYLNDQVICDCGILDDEGG
jgi:hypothetical protein